MKVVVNTNINEFSFIIISPEPNLGRFRSTCNSIANNYKNQSVLCVLPQNATENIDEYKKNHPTYMGGSTITSLINVGMKKTKTDWNIIIIEGSWVKPNIDKKYSKFIKSNKEILFPIVCDYDIQGKITRIYQNFWDCSLNGILFNRQAFEEVGNISDGPLDDARLSWCYGAQKKGWLFKAILGAKIC